MDGKWKRAAEEIRNGVISNGSGLSERAHKRSRNADGSASPRVPSISLPGSFARLVAEIDQLVKMEGLSDGIMNHAVELRKLITASSSPQPPGSNSIPNENNHTDVPPPFPVAASNGTTKNPACSASLQILDSTNPDTAKFGTLPGFVEIKSEPDTTASPQTVGPGVHPLPSLPPITDLALLSAPFTHSSTLSSYIPPTSTNTYEPLEFLGDAYLEVIATRIIHSRFPDHSVGQKAQLRETLIRNDTLAQYARAYDFGARVKVAGVERECGKAWTKVLADVFEAYVSCIILSDPTNGFSTTEKWLLDLWAPKMLEWSQGEGKGTAVQESAAMDVKSELQRLLVSRGARLEYMEERPMEHVKEGNKTTFYMGVYLTGWGYNRQRLGSGKGRNKAIASAKAAEDAFLTGRAILNDAHRKKVEYDLHVKKPRRVEGGVRW